jgi:hypothetical protein
VICPHCKNELKDNEGLLMQDDAFGDAVVYHVRAKSRLNPIAGAHVTSWCGGAGFKTPWTQNGVKAERAWERV